jgi:endonuclease/exonuclease/phosphatase family metal-dependent hydrolase
MHLTVVTWNILGCRGCPVSGPETVVFQEVNPVIIRSIADRLQAWNADIAILQEAPPRQSVEEMARHAGLYWDFFPAQAEAGSAYPFGFPGAVLAKTAIGNACDLASMVRTQDDHRFHRHWGSATIGHPLGALRASGVHLCSDWGDQNREPTRIAEADCLAIRSDIDLVAGDFNTLESSPVIARLRAAGWRDAWVEGHGQGRSTTADARGTSHHRLDYLWLSAASPWRSVSARVIDAISDEAEGIPLLLSDHFPLIVDIELANTDRT